MPKHENLMPADFNSEKSVEKHQSGDPSGMKRRDFLKGMGALAVMGIAGKLGSDFIASNSEKYEREKKLKHELEQHVNTISDNAIFINNHLDGGYCVERFEPGEKGTLGSMPREDDAQKMRERLEGYQKNVEIYKQKIEKGDWETISPAEVQKMEDDSSLDRIRLEDWVQRHQ